MDEKKKGTEASREYAKAEKLCKVAERVWGIREGWRSRGDMKAREGGADCFCAAVYSARNSPRRHLR